MGKVMPYRRRKSRWTRIDSYGPPPRDRPPRRRGRLSLIALRPFALAATLVVLWIGWDPALVEVPALLAGEPERVSMNFTRCGPGRGEACVIDGDTFKLGERKIRVVGIDAPEVKAQCPAEAQAAEAATAELLRLLDLGPFEMVARLDQPSDRWGRELRTVRRMGQDGAWVSIADQMRESGHARRYLGGLRTGWC
jgi:micrococcal nuclease